MKESLLGIKQKPLQELPIPQDARYKYLLLGSLDWLPGGLPKKVLLLKEARGSFVLSTRQYIHKKPTCLNLPSGNWAIGQSNLEEQKYDLVVLQQLLGDKLDPTNIVDIKKFRLYFLLNKEPFAIFYFCQADKPEETYVIAAKKPFEPIQVLNTMIKVIEDGTNVRLGFDA